MPAVSVILPTYNRGYCLMRAVASVVAQTWRDWELVLVDDGSTDNTHELRSRYACALGSKYQEIETDRLGPSGARNAGMAVARGEWLAFMDSDDVWLPEKLAMQMEILRARPNCAISFTNYFEFGDDLAIIHPRHAIAPELADSPYPLTLQIKHNQIACPTIIMRRDLLASVGEFDVAMRVCEDIDLWTRAARKTKFALVNTPLLGVHHRTGTQFPFAASLLGRAELYDRARARDPQLGNDFVAGLYEEAIMVYRDLASARAQLRLSHQLSAAIRDAPTEAKARVDFFARTVREIAGELSLRPQPAANFAR